MRIFLVEDESLLAMMLETMLEDLGHEVADSADSLEEAVKKAKQAEFDCALLDVNLRGEVVYPVADVLTARGLPFVFASGYGGAGLPQQFKDKPVIAKPFQLEDLSAALSNALESRSGSGSE